MSPKGTQSALLLLVLSGIAVSPLAAQDRSHAIAAAVLQNQCLRCHNPETQNAGLDLSSRPAALEGGKNGPALLPDQPAQSPLYRKVASGEMPFDRTLSEEEQAAFLQWVVDGAVWPALDAGMPPALPKDEVHRNLTSEKTEIEPAPIRRAVDFENEIFPILRENCFRCHGPERQRAELRLDSKSVVFRGARSGRVLVPRKAQKSRLFHRIMGFGDEVQMPPEGRKLNNLEAGLIRAWIDQGADWPSHVGVRQGVRQHWAFTRAAQPPLPGRAGGPKHPIDRFIRARLEEKGLSPVEEADRRTLMRRAYLGLIGLPPTPGEVSQFETDGDPQAWERLIDRLLDSPHYGERWARHWLDVARYSESEAYEFDVFQRWAFQYRDFVIWAFNENLPYDRFLRWQVAGDEIAPGNRQALAATGFAAVGPNQTNEPNELEEYDALDDILGTTTLATLGLTVACARCHNHKYDPITQKDYYRMLAFFRPSHRVDHNLTALERPDLVEEAKRKKEALEAWVRPHRRRIMAQRLGREGVEESRLERFLAYYEDPRAHPLETEELSFLLGLNLKGRYSADKFVRHSLPEEQQQQWQRLEESLEQARDKLEFAYGLKDKDRDAPPTWLLGAGNPANKIEQVEPVFLPVLTSPGAPPDRWVSAPGREGESTLLRTALANWITDAEMGAGLLAARVAVNRIWQHHMNEPLVPTVNNFGLAGLPPTHPRLLDWLAHDFIASGWDIKRLHRLIMTSATYRLSSRRDERLAAADPDNLLYWRRNVRRLEAETIRDSILAVSGKLNRTLYGPSVKPRIHPDALATATNPRVADWPADIVDGPETWRRSIYILARRSMVVPFIETFDGPTGMISVGRRQSTVLPTQSLFFLNSQFVREHSGYLAQRVMDLYQDSPGEQIQAVFRLALGRLARAPEIELSRKFLQDQSFSYRLSEAGEGKTDEELHRMAMTDLCQAILTQDEFIYTE